MDYDVLIIYARDQSPTAMHWCDGVVLGNFQTSSGLLTPFLHPDPPSVTGFCIKKYKKTIKLLVDRMWADL